MGGEWESGMAWDLGIALAQSGFVQKGVTYRCSSYTLHKGVLPQWQNSHLALHTVVYYGKFHTGGGKWSRTKIIGIL